MGNTDSILYSSEDDEQSENELRGGATRVSTTGSTTTARIRPLPRPGPAEQLPQKPLVILRGIILGMSRTGKHTLAQRLQGKNPFLSHQHEESSSSRHPDLRRQRHENILIPYKPPSRGSSSERMASWDRIKLNIDISRVLPTSDSSTSSECAVKKETSNAKSNSNQGSANYHFFVILVDPLHPAPKRVKAHLQDTLRQIIQSVYGDPGGAASRTTPYISKSNRPLCLCVLLNFRDLVSGTADNDRIQSSDIQSWTMEILLNELDHALMEDPSLMVLQLAESSLQNCYGLEHLHHFIFQTYLMQKQAHARQMILDTQRELQKSKETVSNNPYLTSYSDFLVILEGGAVPARSGTLTKEKQSRKKRKSKKKKSSKKEDMKGRKLLVTDDLSEADSVQLDKEETQVSGSIHPDPPPSDPGKELEAFLASEDENDDPKPKTAIHSEENSDSSDEEFFFEGRNGANSRPSDESPPLEDDASSAVPYKDDPVQESPVGAKNENSRSSVVRGKSDGTISDSSGDSSDRKAQEKTKGVDTTVPTVSVTSCPEARSEEASIQSQPSDTDTETLESQDLVQLAREAEDSATNLHSSDNDSEQIGNDDAMNTNAGVEIDAVASDRNSVEEQNFDISDNGRRSSNASLGSDLSSSGQSAVGSLESNDFEQSVMNKEDEIPVLDSASNDEEGSGKEGSPRSTSDGGEDELSSNKKNLSPEPKRNEAMDESSDSEEEEFFIGGETSSKKFDDDPDESEDDYMISEQRISSKGSFVDPVERPATCRSEETAPSTKQGALSREAMEAVAKAEEMAKKMLR